MMTSTVASVAGWATARQQDPPPGWSSKRRRSSPGCRMMSCESVRQAMRRETAWGMDGECCNARWASTVWDRAGDYISWKADLSGAEG